MPSTAAVITPRRRRLGADADGDDRLAEGDDHDQAVALGEVVRARASSPRPRTGTGRACRARARRIHSAPCATPSSSEAATSRPMPIAVLITRPTTEWRSAGSSRLAIRNSTIWPAARRRRRCAKVRPRSPNASGTQSDDDQQRRHRGEHGEPDRALLGVDDAGQPGVADPGPPQHAEHERAPGEPLPGRVVRPSARCTG